MAQSYLNCCASSFNRSSQQQSLPTSVILEINTALVSLGRFPVGKPPPLSGISALKYYNMHIIKCSSSCIRSQIKSFSFLISSLKAPRAPDFSLFPELIGDTFAVAIVGYAISISLGKTFGLKHGYKVDSNQVSNANITLADRWDGQIRWCFQTAVVVILRISVPV